MTTKQPARRAAANSPLPGYEELQKRAHIATAEAHRAQRMLKMLMLVTNGEVLADDHQEEIDGIYETLACISGIVDRVANMTDPVTLLALESQS